MEKRAFCTVALVACVICTANAATFVLPVQCSGQYSTSTLQTIQLDFGRSFADIQGMSIAWSGYVVPGWWVDLVWGSGPDPGYFEATLKDDVGQIAKIAHTPFFGASMYPAPQAFDETNQFSPFLNYMSWDFLLDGRAILIVDLQAPAHIHTAVSSEEPPLSYPPTGYIQSCQLILEATPIPEPSGLLILLSSLGGLGGVTWLRKRRK